MGTLIGIGVEFQCGPDLRAVEATILQESRLTCPLGVIARQLGPEALRTHGPDRRQPIDVGCSQSVIGVVVGDPALRELGANALWALTLGNARAHEAVGEACVGERTAALELVERSGD